MFCTKCGGQNDDNSHRCTSCGEVLRRPGEIVRDPEADGAHLGPARHGLAQSILVTIFCCQILGIIAIVFSALAMGQNSAGNYRLAHDYAKKANMFAWIGLGVGLLVMVPYVIFVILGAASGTP